MDPLWAQGHRQYHRIFEKSRKKKRKTREVHMRKKSKAKQQEIG
jgi:hypothetical protein